MAGEAAKKETAGGKVQPIRPRKKKGKALWIILALVLLGAAGAGGLALRHAAVGRAGTGKGAQVAQVPLAAPIYYKFDPPFVVNFGGAGSARYLQVTVQAMSRDSAILKKLKANDPAVRNALLLLFSSQTADGVASATGKEKLQTEALQTIRNVLDSLGDNGKLIDAVYFTSFVTQ